MNILPCGVQLGVSPLSWTNDVLEDLGSDIPLESCLSDAADTGYDGIELGRKFPRQVSSLGPLLATHGLDLISGWYSGELAERSVAEEIEAVRKHATLLRDMQCQVIVYGEVGMMAGKTPLDTGMSNRRLMTKSQRKAYAQRLDDFSAHLLGTYGLRLAYHHHLMMVVETFEEIAEIFDATGPETGLLLDTGHAASAGFNYQLLIDSFAPRIVHIHLKDVRSEVMDLVRSQDRSFNDGVRSGMFTVPGDGIVDFSPIAQFVQDHHYQGWLVVEAEQDPVQAPPRAAVTRARGHILSVFHDLRRTLHDPSA